MRGLTFLFSLLMAGTPAFCVACDDGGAGEHADASETVAFSNFSISGLTANRVEIQFDTDVPTDCAIEFGTTMDLGREAVDPDMAEGEVATEHDVPLEDLTESTLYYYRARATTEAGVTVLSEMQFVETLSAVDPTEGLTNFALLSKGTSVLEVSSNLAGAANDESWGIHNALDGSMETEWSSNGDGDTAFVLLDFGKTRTISVFAFRSRKMSDGTSITKSLQLEVGAEVIGPFATDNPDQRYTFELEVPLETKTVRVRYLESTGGNTGAKEIELYGAQ